jgi:hypothetical protein
VNQAAGNRHARYHEKGADWLNETFGGFQKPGIVRGETLPALGSLLAYHWNFRQPRRRRRWSGRNPGLRGRGEFLDIVREACADDEEWQQQHQNHPQRHDQRSQRAPAAE